MKRGKISTPASRSQGGNDELFWMRFSSLHERPAYAAAASMSGRIAYEIHTDENGRAMLSRIVKGARRRSDGGQLPNHVELLGVFDTVDEAKRAAREHFRAMLKDVAP